MSAPQPTHAPRKAREWPLVMGLVVAAALVVASTRVGASGDQVTPRPVAHRTGAGGVGPTLVPTAPEAAPTHARRAPHRTAVKSAPAPKRATHVAARPHHAATAAAAPADDAPAAKPAPKPRHHPHPSSPSTPAPSSSPSLAVPGKSGQTTIGGTTFTVRATTHSPAAGDPWTITVSATRGGAPVAGTVAMDVIYQGKVGGHVATARLKNGGFTKKIVWPDRSVGYPLTMRIKMEAGGQSCGFLYDFEVRAAG